MGFSLSWVAFKGLGADEACAAFEAERTGEFAEFLETDLAGLELPGWYLILVDDRGEYATNAIGFAEKAKLPTEVLSLHVEETGGLYSLDSHIEGKQQWRVCHNCNERPIMAIEGDVPPELAQVLSRLEERRLAEIPNSEKGAYDTEAAADLGQALIGFRHDLVDESPVFETLRLPAWDQAMAQRPAPVTSAGHDPSRSIPGLMDKGSTRPWWQFW